MAAGCQVVVVQGKAFAEPWMKQSLPAILEAWQSGQAQGQAIAETLFGVNNPAGRTAVTFPSSADVLPVFYNYHPTATRGEWCAQTRTSSTLMGPLHQHRGLRGEGGAGRESLHAMLECVAPDFGLLLMLHGWPLQADTTTHL
jgi:hypothetical protein